MNRLASSVLVMLAALGCAVAQRPLSFSTQLVAGDAAEKVGRALAAAGHPPAFVDAAAQLVESAWEVLPAVSGSVQGFPAVLARRVVATWSSAEGGPVTVTVRMDLKRCVQGDAYVEGRDVSGTCEAVTDAMPSLMQDELDRVGARVKDAL